jgi:fatty-acyl-CoA synthase
LYTSGTTGNPKGALLPHRQVLWNCINTVVSWGLRPDDVSPVFTPLFHAGGLFAFLTPLHYVGGRAVLARTFDAEASLQTIQSEGCSVVLGVPTLFQVWKDTPAFEQADFSRVRFFINGGASISPALMQAWREAKGVVMRQGYGLTEAGVNCFSMTDEDSVRKAGSVGKPMLHSQARLVDPETGDEVAAGQTGELILAGPHVCLGYWRNPQASAEALRPHPQLGGDQPWLHTGDMARMDEDGFFYINGRYKDMIKSGGENIYAAEVEAVFREHPAVADAALIGLPDDKWGETGLMVVVVSTGFSTRQAGLEQELKDFCQGKLARFKIPKAIAFVDALPYSPYGKVMKTELKKRYS